jgi:hypothetical protein
MIKMCCACHKVEEGGQWRVNRTFTEDERVTHAYCPDCYAAVMAEIEGFIGGKIGCALRPPPWSSVHGSCLPCA